VVWFAKVMGRFFEETLTEGHFGGNPESIRGTPLWKQADDPVTSKKSAVAAALCQRSPKTTRICQ
jgi:hypothetical protein